MKKRSPNLWEVQELFRDAKWMEASVDETIKNVIKNASFYPVRSKTGLKMAASIDVYNDRISVESKCKFSEFEESLFWFCDKASSDFDLPCAKRWLKRLQKLTDDLKYEIEQAEK